MEQNWQGKEVKTDEAAGIMGVICSISSISGAIQVWLL